jgi:hypothetical protein
MEICDKHVEWAVVDRLKKMLDTPPETEFQVTQSFAMFSTVVLWTKQRAWVGGDIDRPEDHAARGVREALRSASIFEKPWLLSKVRPQLRREDGQNPLDLADGHINCDFEDMNAEQFVKWLRDALAHGDGRRITPLHSRRSNRAVLSGFTIVSPADRGSTRSLTLSLYHSDMKRIGGILAGAFCTALSGGNKSFEHDVGSAMITEAA